MLNALRAATAVAVLLTAFPARGADGVALTDDQKRLYQQSTKIRDEAEKPLLLRQREGLRKVRALIADAGSERSIQLELEGLARVFEELRVVKLRYDASLAGGLTSLQRAKLAAAAAAAPRRAPVAGAEAKEAPPGVPGDEEEEE